MIQKTIKEFYVAMKDGVSPLNRENMGIHVTFAAIPLLLLLFLNFGSPRSFIIIFQKTTFLTGLTSSEIQFWAQAYTTLCTFFFFFLIPIFIQKLFPIDIEYPYGMRIKGTGRHFLVSALVISIMIPILWFSFSSAGLNQFYPIYKPTSISNWLLYECIYLPIFFPTEFFFRGIMLYRLEKFVPGRGVWIAIIGYAIGHIFKPFPEAIGSIFAGYILGVLSLQCRSIWPGFVIHAGIAFLADLFALIESGYIYKIMP